MAVAAAVAPWAAFARVAAVFALLSAALLASACAAFVRTGPPISPETPAGADELFGSNTDAAGRVDGTARRLAVPIAAERLRLEGHTDSVNSVAFSPDGATVATGSSDYTARLWSATTGAELLRLCLLYTSPSPRDQRGSRMPSSA